MLPLLLAAALQTAEPALPVPSDAVEDAFSLGTPRGLDGPLMLSIGTPARYLAFICRSDRREVDLVTRFAESVGVSIRADGVGGFRVRYSFDGAAPGGGIWTAIGAIVLAEGRRRGTHEVLRRLRGTTRIRLVTRRRDGRGEQTSEFAYPDPAPLVDEFARRCGLELER